MIATEVKLGFIQRLAAAGLTQIEAASFVSPKWVPQMADAHQVMTQLASSQGVTYSALTPNMKGLEGALAAGVKEVAVFAAASEGFSQKNINCSISDSLARFEPVIATAREHGIAVRGYVSTVLGCPYQGEVPLVKVREVSSALHQMGCYEISLGDTIGVGTPDQARRMVNEVAKSVPVELLAAHFHDTYGQALANLYGVLQEGVNTIDSAAAGLGGCPYAKGASGNVASEDVVYLLEGLGIDCGVDLDRLIEAGQWICQQLGRENGSKVARARG